jgi:hypothetical protein
MEKPSASNPEVWQDPTDWVSVVYMKTPKKVEDPCDELRDIKRKMSRELEQARKEGTLLGKRRQMDRRASKLLKPRKRARAK